MIRIASKTVVPKENSLLPRNLGEEIERDRKAEWRRSHPALAAAYEFAETGGNARLPTAAEFTKAANDLWKMRKSGEPVDGLTAQAVNAIMGSRGKFKSWKTKSAELFMRAVEETAACAKIEAEHKKRERKFEETAKLSVLNSINNKWK